MGNTQSSSSSSKPAGGGGGFGANAQQNHGLSNGQPPSTTAQSTPTRQQHQLTCEELVRKYSGTIVNRPSRLFSSSSSIMNSNNNSTRSLFNHTNHFDMMMMPTSSNVSMSSNIAATGFNGFNNNSNGNEINTNCLGLMDAVIKSRRSNSQPQMMQQISDDPGGKNGISTTTTQCNQIQFNEEDDDDEETTTASVLHDDDNDEEGIEEESVELPVNPNLLKLNQLIASSSQRQGGKNLAEDEEEGRKLNEPILVKRFNDFRARQNEYEIRKQQQRIINSMPNKYMQGNKIVENQPSLYVNNNNGISEEMAKNSKNNHGHDHGKGILNPLPLKAGKGMIGTPAVIVNNVETHNNDGQNPSNIQQPKAKKTSLEKQQSTPVSKPIERQLSVTDLIPKDASSTSTQIKKKKLRGPRGIQKKVSFNTLNNNNAIIDDNFEVSQEEPWKVFDYSITKNYPPTSPKSSSRESKRSRSTTGKKKPEDSQFPGNMLQKQLQITKALEISKRHQNSDIQNLHKKKSIETMQQQRQQRSKKPHHKPSKTNKLANSNSIQMPRPKSPTKLPTAIITKTGKVVYCKDCNGNTNYNSSNVNKKGNQHWSGGGKPKICKSLPTTLIQPQKEKYYKFDQFGNIIRNNKIILPQKKQQQFTTTLEFDQQKKRELLVKRNASFIANNAMTKASKYVLDHQKKIKTLKNTYSSRNIPSTMKKEHSSLSRKSTTIARIPLKNATSSRNFPIPINTTKEPKEQRLRPSLSRLSTPKRISPSIPAAAAALAAAAKNTCSRSISLSSFMNESRARTVKSLLNIPLRKVITTNEQEVEEKKQQNFSRPNSRNNNNNYNNLKSLFSESKLYPAVKKSTSKVFTSAKGTSNVDLSRSSSRNKITSIPKRIVVQNNSPSIMKKITSIVSASPSSRNVLQKRSSNSQTAIEKAKKLKEYEDLKAIEDLKHALDLYQEQDQEEPPPSYVEDEDKDEEGFLILKSKFDLYLEKYTSALRSTYHEELQHFKSRHLLKKCTTRSRDNVFGRRDDLEQESSSSTSSYASLIPMIDEYGSEHYSSNENLNDGQQRELNFSETTSFNELSSQQRLPASNIHHLIHPGQYLQEGEVQEENRIDFNQLNRIGSLLTAATDLLTPPSSAINTNNHFEFSLRNDEGTETPVNDNNLGLNSSKTSLIDFQEDDVSIPSVESNTTVDSFLEDSEEINTSSIIDGTFEYLTSLISTGFGLSAIIPSSTSEIFEELLDSYNELNDRELSPPTNIPDNDNYLNGSPQASSDNEEKYLLPQSNREEEEEILVRKQIEALHRIQRSRQSLLSTKFKENLERELLEQGYLPEEDDSDDNNYLIKFDKEIPPLISVLKKKSSTNSCIEDESTSSTPRKTRSRVHFSTELLQTKYFSDHNSSSEDEISKLNSTKEQTTSAHQEDDPQHLLNPPKIVQSQSQTNLNTGKLSSNYYYKSMYGNRSSSSSSNNNNNNNNTSSSNGKSTTSSKRPKTPMKCVDDNELQLNSNNNNNNNLGLGANGNSSSSPCPPSGFLIKRSQSDEILSDLINNRERQKQPQQKQRDTIKKQFCIDRINALD